MDEEKLVEMYGDVKATRTDIKWLKQDSIRRNGIMEEHMKESDKFRSQVTRNTVWRITHHFLFGLVGTGIIAIGYVLWQIVK